MELVSKLSIPNFRKIKSKMMFIALKTGSSTSGNHKVVYTAGGTVIVPSFDFYYRDTMIATVAIDQVGATMTNVDAGVYDNTASTMRQRKDIKAAVDEFNVAMLKEGVIACG